MKLNAPILFFALLTAAASASAESHSMQAHEQYKTALASSLATLQADGDEWQAVAMQLARSMDRGEWA